MDNKIEVLNKKMKELDGRLFVGYTFIEYDDSGIALKFIDNDKEDWYLGKYYFDDNTFEKTPKGIAPDLYDELAKYFDNFKELCKELFEGDNKMEEQKIIEVTNLDELQKLLSDSKKLVCKLQSKIDKINNWRPEYKEKEEDKIDILDEYMKSLDERLFVREDDYGVMLCFYYDNYDYTLCYINSTDEIIVPEIGLADYDTFNELLKYKYAFKGKYDELYGVEE